MRGPTPRQSEFVRQYLIDLNGTRAARDAGYRGTDATVPPDARERIEEAFARWRHNPSDAGEPLGAADGRTRRRF